MLRLYPPACKCTFRSPRLYPPPGRLASTRRRPGSAGGRQCRHAACAAVRPQGGGRRGRIGSTGAPLSRAVFTARGGRVVPWGERGGGGWRGKRPAAFPVRRPAIAAATAADRAPSAGSGAPGAPQSARRAAALPSPRPLRPRRRRPRTIRGRRSAGPARGPGRFRFFRTCR